MLMTRAYLSSTSTLLKCPPTRRPCWCVRQRGEWSRLAVTIPLRTLRLLRLRPVDLSGHKQITSARSGAGELPVLVGSASEGTVAISQPLSSCPLWALRHQEVLWPFSRKGGTRGMVERGRLFASMRSPMYDAVRYESSAYGNVPPGGAWLPRA